MKFQHHFDLLVNKGTNTVPVSAKAVVGHDQTPTCIEVDCEESKEITSGKLSLETIQETSKIYGRYSKQSKLSDWQKAVNKAAYNMCVKDPDNMYDRAKLKYDAEEEARKTYVFKKAAGSRSKYEEGETSTKRAKLTSEQRQTEIEMCSSKIKSLASQVIEKQNGISRSLSVKNFEKCTLLQKEYRGLMAERKRQENRLTELQKKEAKHLKYKSKKEKRRGETEINCQPKKSCVNDIRSMLIVKEKTPITEDDTGNQSDDTLILSDNESDIGNKIITSLEEENVDSQIKASVRAQENTGKHKAEIMIISEEKENHKMNENYNKEDQTEIGDGKERNIQIETKIDDPTIDKDENSKVAKEGEFCISKSSTAAQNKSNKPDGFQGETSISENKCQGEVNFF